ncbi:prevent-host-death family protein [Modicisalibacter xianhensis]|uniref:Antitoxin n=1 Tax=Modicisalibacter xianhensis TaxID=442341 RepID=A0A4R8FMV2_9GAMM|nr:type II toxin-antitoxin system prevent-host-death family antitoxin [Halomonas xianhensis]TDX27599.1 prevent-host-death family protein [Halomonas xianhensis]
MQINMHEAKSQLSALVEKARQGEKIIIAKSGKPCVEIVPCQVQPRRQPGRYKGRIRLSEDFATTPDEVIDSFEGN